MASTSSSVRAVSFGIALSVVGIVVAGWYLPAGWNWPVIALLLILVSGLIGVGVTGRPFGILINQRNLMSLSRFQMVLWTVLVLSAYFTVVLMRIRQQSIADPLLVGIPWQVWTLLGISTASLVGSPMIYAGKTAKEPDPKIVEAAGKPWGFDKETVNANREGVLYGNPSVKDAEFTDIFEGDELKNTRFVDLAKVQMFLFTVIVAVAYATEVFEIIQSADLDGSPFSLPTIDEGLLALMGISNTGYLANKGIDHTPTQN